MLLLYVIIKIILSISAMGPVRLFTPYKRKRRNQEPEEKKKSKRESVLAESDVDNIHQTSNNSHSKEAWQSITDGLESSNEYHIMENPETKPDPTLNTEKSKYLFIILILICYEIIVA